MPWDTLAHISCLPRHDALPRAGGCPSAAGRKTGVRDGQGNAQPSRGGSVGHPPSARTRMSERGHVHHLHLGATPGGELNPRKYVVL